MRGSLGERGDAMDDDAIFTELRVELTRTIATERQLTDEQMTEALKQAAKPDSMPLWFLRRTRHWTDGAIIGAKAFVQETASHFFTPERLAKRQLSRGQDAVAAENDGQGVLYCLRRLRL